MRIGIAGPISLDVLAWPDGPPQGLPETHNAPLVAFIANALLDRGHQVTVFALAGVRQPAVYSSGALTVCLAQARARHRARDMFAEERRALSALMQAHPCTVLHAHWTYEYAMAALACGRPALITAHDHAATVLRYSPDGHRAVRLAMDAAVKRHANLLTVTSPYLFRRLSPRLRQKARVIPNCFDPQMLTRPPSRSCWTLKPDRPRVVSISNGFGRRKNVETLLIAAEIMHSCGSPCLLSLLGVDMEANGPAARWASRYGLSEGVEFLGPLPYPQVLARIADADVLVHTAREEAFGMTILEAMVLGTPTVAGSTSGNLPDLLGHGSRGVLCDIEDAADVAAATLALLAEPAAMRSLAKAARRYATQAHAVDAIVPQYLAAYRDVLEAAQRSDES